MGVRGWVLAAGLVLAGPMLAQDEVPLSMQPAPPVLIVDTERLYSDSAYAESLRLAVEQDALALAEENDRIVADLTEEERSLTERRPDMDPAAFREEAEAFDIKVQEIRRARDAKEAELQQARASVRVQFFETARPVIGRLMVERGAVAVIDSRSAVVAVRSIDITSAAISRIDDTLLTPDSPPEE